MAKLCFCIRPNIFFVLFCLYIVVIVVVHTTGKFYNNTDNYITGKRELHLMEVEVNRKIYKFKSPLILCYFWILSLHNSNHCFVGNKLKQTFEFFNTKSLNVTVSDRFNYAFNWAIITSKYFKISINTNFTTNNYQLLNEYEQNIMISASTNNW